ncbi:MAG TPA: GDSL-type esterase/lipase family protein [Sandaracinaceae bacterium LLY-WYZ-13_1]|nr:GDSL-type esterase/lipase family protein [Sandaracinaceae bacterium LLY-WYZ-13_1]
MARGLSRSVGALALGAATALTAVGVGAQPSSGRRDLATQVWIEDPSGRALARFHRALARSAAGEGRTRILVWGASHTASDQFTGFLRAAWQRRFGDGGPGFVLPARPFSLYDHREARVAPRGRWRTLRVRGRRRAPGAYGPAGFALEADGRADGWIALDAPVDTVRLHYLRRPGGGSLELRAGGARRRRRTDGEGPAVLALSPEDGARRIEVRARGGRVRLFGASLERGDGGVIVDALGVPGARLRDRLPWDDASLRAQLRRLGPDLIVLAYGTNESGFRGRPLRRYRREANEAIRRARAAAPRASCLLIGPSDWPERADDGTWRARERTARVAAIQRDAARRHGCGYFDLVAFTGGPASMHRWVEAGLALSDHVHFTDEGHRRLARVLSRALLRGASLGG